MTAIRLADGSLFLHSPVALDDGTKADLEALGPVRFVVAPNKVHHLFVAPYRDAFPGARLLAAPGLMAKRPALPFDAELGPQAEEGYAADLDQMLFAGMPWVNEIVFLHRASRTLLLTDLAMNFRDGLPAFTRLWVRLMGLHRGFGVSRMLRQFVRDREAARASLEALLRWDFERVVVSHGAVLQGSGKRMVREAWSFLRPVQDRLR